MRKAPKPTPISLVSPASDWELPRTRVVRLRAGRAGAALIIPVWNEGKRILSQLERLKPFTDRVDVWLADGGSRDGSTETKRLRELGVTVLLETEERGLGTALRMGLGHALAEDYPYLLTVDGNGKDGVDAIPRFLAALDGGVDFVQGSRYRPGGSSLRTPWSRWFGTRAVIAPLISMSAGFFFTDPTNGFKGFRREVFFHPGLKPFRRTFSHFNFQFYLNCTIPRLGYRTIEIPVVRDYPPEELPTKIVGLKPHLRLLRELAAACLGAYRPSKKDHER